MTATTDAKLFTRNATVCAIVIASLLLSAKIFAADATNSETVKFSDLNVSSPAGAAALYHRIHSAAARLCDFPNSNELSMEMRGLQRQCVAKAEAHAVQQLNIDALSAYYDKKTGRSTPMVAQNKGK